MMQFPKYSIVIPAYNERDRIPDTLRSVVECIRTHNWPAEVVVVDDGSRDDTATVVRQFALQAPEVRLIENPSNFGKGYSVRTGILHALGDIVMFTDADLSSPIEEAEGLFSAIGMGADIAIGSRWLASSRQTRRQPLFRQFFGRCFNALTRWVMRLPFADTQCGFKAFTRSCRANRLPTSNHRTLGIRSRNPVHRPPPRLPRSGGSRRLGPRCSHAHELSARRSSNVERARPRTLERASRPL